MVMSELRWHTAPEDTNNSLKRDMLKTTPTTTHHFNQNRCKLKFNFCNNFTKMRRAKFAFEFFFFFNFIIEISYALSTHCRRVASIFVK